jgi:hypothetical protein
MIDLEPIIAEAQQAKKAECYAQLKPQTLIELCAELKALRAENAQLRAGQSLGANCGTWNPYAPSTLPNGIAFAPILSPSTKS